MYVNCIDCCIISVIKAKDRYDYQFMMKATSKGLLSDKDLQLLKRTFCKLTQLYYESPKSDSALNDLLNFSKVLTQVIISPRDSETLSLTSTIEILKVKSKSSPTLIACADSTLLHLRNPKPNPLQYQTLLYSLQRSQIFVAGCTIAIRFYDKITTGQFDWKEILNELSRNISVSPSLCIQLVYQICRENQALARAAVKCGLVKYIFLSHIKNTLEDKYNLYKSIKLLKVISQAQRTLLREREKPLALIIFTYDDYIPVIEQICARCYDHQYCLAIDRKKISDQLALDQLYLWSFAEPFVTRALSEDTVTQLIKSLQIGLPQDKQTKTFAILANYSKFKKTVRKQALQLLPRSQKALLNFVKLCVSCCQTDQNSLAAVDMTGLQALVQRSQSPKVGQLFKYLKELRSRQKGVGVISDSVKRLFDMEKNADFLMERASKVPQSNEQLSDIRQILKEKERTNQFQSDTLKTVKERALNSLQTAIIQKRKLDLSLLLKDVELTDVKLLAKLLSILQLNLTMNEQLIEQVPAGRVFEIIQWIEQHYAGQLIEWSSIGQLLTILAKKNQWRSHLAQAPEKCFWLLGAQEVQGDAEQALFARLEEIKKNMGKHQAKIPFLIGFLGRSLNRELKVKLYQRFPQFFQLLLRNLKENTNYKTNLVMFSCFLKDWHSDNEQHNKIFEELIEKILTIILSNFRSLDQEYEVLQNCLPYKMPVDKLSDNVQYLVGQHGRLASYIYRENMQKGTKVAIAYDRIRAVGHLPPEKSRQILEILSFLEDNGQILQDDELSPLLDVLNGRKLAYWLMYPNFFNILSRIIAILAKTNNQAITKNITALLFKILAALNANGDISDQQRHDLLLQLQTCIAAIGKRGVFIDKDKLRRGVEKVKDEDLKDQLNKLIDSLQVEIKQEPQQGQQEKAHITQPKLPGKQQQKKNIEETHEQSQNNGLEDLQRREQPFNIDKHFSTGKQSELMQALRDLKKIIQKQLPQQTFNKLNQVFLTHPFRQEHKDMLGYLLVKFYPNRPQPLKAMARQLISRKEKTYLSKESCYELLKNHKQAFVLAKRWKLSGREWLDLAIQRMAEGYYGIGSQIVQYNLPRTADLEYFYSKKYHDVTLKCFPKVEQADELAYFLVLVGTSARFPQIKKAYIRQKLHIRILQAYQRFPENLKLIGNLSYALSALAYIQPDVCLQITKQKQELTLLLGKYRTHWDNRPIVESGACLVANLAYSNEEVKELLRQLNCAEVFLAIFQKLLEAPEISTFKQLLRALGNLSLSAKFAQQMIDNHFCTLAVKMMEKLDIFVHLDEKKAVLMKIMIDLIANLASHRHRLDVFHHQKLTIAILTMLQTTQQHPAILMACIDTIDCLCQNPEIQSYVVTQKKILYLLVDVLKVQTDQKIVVKSTRLLTNLTINPACIPYILQANLLSVLASIVMPHFYGNKLAAEQKKKMETYILKIITRIYHSKQNKDLILRSGYLDCLLRTIQTSDVIEDAYIEILYSYSDSLPSFLNKRAFLCLLRIIAKKMANRDSMARCFRIIKSLSNLYQRDQEDVLLQEAPQMYQKLLSSNEYREQGLFLLAYHLLRSYKLRLTIQKRIDRVLQYVKQLSDDSKLTDLCREIFFITFNPYSVLREIQGEGMEQSYQLLKNGFKCNLYRMDGSSKKAVINMNEEYELRAYKYPDGQIKKKYVIDIKNLKDFQFTYPVSEQLWNSTVFMMEKGLFDSRKASPQNCCSLIGSSKWGELSFINVQFDSEEEKMRFYKCVSLIFHSVR